MVLEMRDGHKSQLLGKCALNALVNINDINAPNPSCWALPRKKQTSTNRQTETLDGTHNEWCWSKAKFGANATLANSMMVCRAGATASEVLLHPNVSKPTSKPTDKSVMPVPSFNVINR